MLRIVWSFFVIFLCLLVTLTGCSNSISMETECNLAGQAQIVQNVVEVSRMPIQDVNKDTGQSLEDKKIAQDKRAKIRDYLNREILIRDTFAGQSITLIRENEDYFVVRTIFGSGVPVVGSIKYKAKLQSDWQIRFSKTTDASHSEHEEHFILGVSNEGLELFLNGLQVVIKEPVLDDK